MKLKTNQIIKTYYLLLLAIVAVQAVATVFGMSRTIYYQKQLNQLQNEHDTLLTQKLNLEKQLSQELSLSHNSLTANNEFEPIKNPLVIQSDHRVALK